MSLNNHNQLPPRKSRRPSYHTDGNYGMQGIDVVPPTSEVWQQVERSDIDLAAYRERMIGNRVIDGADAQAVLESVEPSTLNLNERRLLSAIRRYLD